MEPAPDPGFRARGGLAGTTTTAGGAELVVFHLGAGRAAEPLGDLLHPDDELAFAYRNQTPGVRLLVFARDEHGHVYWYHPAWTDAAQDPPAVPLAATPGLHELPAAIAHPFDGHRLDLCWLFTTEPLRARQVEAAVAAGSLAPACRKLEVAP
jgi:hypothetical protein